MKRAILIFVVLAVILISLSGYSDRGGSSTSSITSGVQSFQPDPFSSMEEDLILLGLPLDMVPAEQKVEIIQDMENRLANYSGRNAAQLKMAAADALSSVITNDDSIAGIGLVSRASAAAYNLNVSTPDLQKALYQVHALEDRRVDSQVMHHGKKIEDMAGKRFPAGTKIPKWQQALLLHQNSARALLKGFEDPDTARAFNTNALDAPRTEEPTEKQTKILNHLIMNQELPESVRADAIRTAVRFRNAFKNNVRTDNDEARVSFIDSQIAQGFDQNIRYHDESDVFGNAAVALSEIGDFDTLGKALNHRMQKRNWQQDYGIRNKENYSYGKQVLPDEFDAYSSALSYFLDGAGNAETKEDVLTHAPALINTVLGKDDKKYDGNAAPVAVNARERISTLLNQFKEFMEALTPEERLQVASQIELAPDSTDWMKDQYATLLDDLGMKKVGECDDGEGGKSPGKVVLKTKIDLKKTISEIEGLEERLQGATSRGNAEAICSARSPVEDEEETEEKEVLKRLLKLRAERMEEMAKAYHSLRAQGFDVELPKVCKNEFGEAFDSKKSKSVKVEKDLEKILDKAMADSYALADIQDDIRYFSEGGSRWRYGTVHAVGYDSSETERSTVDHWVKYNRPGTGEFPSSAFMYNDARDSYYAPHLNQERNLYEEIHEKIKQNRNRYDAVLAGSGGIAAGHVRKGVPFHDVVYKEVYLEGGLLSSSDYSVEEAREVYEHVKRVRKKRKLPMITGDPFHSDEYLSQFRNIPQRNWNPFWQGIFDLGVPISEAVTYAGAGTKESRGWNNHAERAVIEYPKILNHLRSEVQKMNLRVRDPNEMASDGLKDRELAEKYKNYIEALKLVENRYQEKLGQFKRNKGQKLLKEARKYNADKFNNYLGELCNHGNEGTDAEKIENLQYLALDEKLRKKTLTEENEKSDCELSKHWANYEKWESRTQMGLQVGAGLLFGAAAAAALASSQMWLLGGAVAGEMAAAVAIDTHYYNKKKALSDKLSTAYEASGGKFGTSQTIVERNQAANDAWSDVKVSVMTAPLAVVFQAKGFLALGRAYKTFREARRFGDARHVLRAKDILIRAKTLWRTNVKAAELLILEAKGILRKVGTEASDDITLARSLLGEVTGDIARSNQLKNAYRPLRKYAYANLLPEGQDLSKLSKVETSIAKQRASDRMMRLMRAAGVNMTDPESLQKFSRTLRSNPNFKQAASKIFKAYGDDQQLLNQAVEAVGGFDEFAPMATNLARHFDDPEDMRKFFDTVIGNLKPHQTVKGGHTIGLSSEEYADFLRQLKDPNSQLFQKFREKIACRG